MAVERTLCIIKPDAVSKNYTGKIIDHILEKGFRILGMRWIHMTKKQAEGFYAVHRGKPFFEDLTMFMSSGPCVPIVLERENAVAYFREVIGATNPEEAADQTIRKLYGESTGHNAVHGSDSPQNAINEIGYFFAHCDLTG